MSFFPRTFAKRKAELDEEIQAHLQMDIQDRKDRGASPEQARSSAIREFGNVALIEDVTREARGWVWLERLGQDLKYAFRQLRRSPAFTITVIATLTLGLGATAAMFTVVDHVLLRPLPYDDSHQLVTINEAGKKGITGGTPFLDLRQWRQRSHTLEEIAFYSATNHLSFLDGNTGSTRVNAPQISANLFAVLGVHPAMGRGFEGQSDGSVLAGESHNLILSDPVWRTTYGGDPYILGKAVKLNGESYIIVGVMPRGFTFPFGDGNAHVWLPKVIGDKDTVRVPNTTPNYGVIARLKPNVSLDNAESELKVIQSDVAKEYTDPYDRERVTSIKLQRYEDTLVGSDLKKALLALFGASGVLWLIACVNGASLMLARSTARQREIAVRGALGASRWRIVQQLAIEGLLLSAIASALGLGLAMLMLKLFEHGLTQQFHIHEKMSANLTVIGLLAALTIVSALLCSVWPALVAAKAPIEPALRQGGPQSSAGTAQYRTRASLVVLQIAMSLILLVGCGLLLRTIYALRHVPLGFRTDHIIVANMTIPAYRFAGQNMTTELYQPLVDRANRMPGVQSASLMTAVPLATTFKMQFTFNAAGNSAAEVRRRDLVSQFRAVGPEMQRVFGFRMLKGRFFNESDTASSQTAVVVNRAFAKQYLGTDNDLGKVLGEGLFNFTKNRRAVIIGVLDDERQVSIAKESQPEIEICIPQITPDTLAYQSVEGLAMDLAIRTDRNPSSIIPELRDLMRQASPELSDSTFTTMDQVVEDSYGSQQLAARLLIVFGGSALLVCITGIYGLLAYLVAHRTKELGLRIALGAQRGDVMWLVLRQAGWMLIAGSSLGLILAYMTSLLLRTFLYNITAHDPWTMAAVTAVLVGGGLAASYIP
ncbi:MAG TPA: ABC transporter permease, partial [Edaphobacter sp.]|nr:ABC transporter permease [Edaphobacter sp.]